MRYEIINPSDKCYLTADSDGVAAASGLLLGEGRYALVSEKGDRTLPLFLFGNALTWFMETFKEELNPFINAHVAEIATCLPSVTYECERTSLNDIGQRAKDIAAYLQPTKS